MVYLLAEGVEEAKFNKLNNTKKHLSKAVLKKGSFEFFPPDSVLPTHLNAMQLVYVTIPPLSLLFAHSVPGVVGTSPRFFNAFTSLLYRRVQ